MILNTLPSLIHCLSSLTGACSHIGYFLEWFLMFVGNVVNNRCPLSLLQFTIIFTWWSCPVTMVNNRLNTRSNLLTADVFWCCFKFLRDTLVKYKSRSGLCKYKLNKNLNIYRNALTWITFCNVPNIKVMIFSAWQSFMYFLTMEWRSVTSVLMFTWSFKNPIALFKPASSMWDDHLTSLLCKKNNIKNNM